jgi:hypothetical protein
MSQRLALQWISIKFAAYRYLPLLTDITQPDTWPFLAEILLQFDSAWGREPRTLAGKRRLHQPRNTRGGHQSRPWPPTPPSCADQEPDLPIEKPHKIIQQT